MTVPDRFPPAAGAPALHRFALTVQAQTETQPWRATLASAPDMLSPAPAGAPPDPTPGAAEAPHYAAAGAADAPHEFDSPLELLRYLARITLLPPRGGGLR
jgi:hypothetical protein